MHPLPEKDYHELFRIGILVKAIDGLLEASAGVFLYFVNYTALSALLFSIFHEEITETPRDPFWQYFINQFHTVSLSGHIFWAFLFFIHGITKLFLSAALLKKYVWAYPTAGVVFTLFVGYEIYLLIGHPSLFLWIITFFDSIVVGLILHEYRYITKAKQA